MSVLVVRQDPLLLVVPVVRGGPGDRLEKTLVSDLLILHLNLSDAQVVIGEVILYQMWAGQVLMLLLQQMMVRSILLSGLKEEGSLGAVDQ